MVDAVGSTEHGPGDYHGQMGQQVSLITYLSHDSWSCLCADCLTRLVLIPSLKEDSCLYESLKGFPGAKRTQG